MDSTCTLEIMIDDKRNHIGIAPAVSIVLPAYNRAGTLGRSIQSILDQSFRDFELIIIDDGSIDNTREVVRSFVDCRINFIRLEKNVGGAAARNIGVSHACAPIIAFQDSDDVWLPGKLEKCIIELKSNSNLSGVFSAFLQIQDGRTSYKPSYIPHEGEMTKAILYENFVDTPTCLIRREIFHLVGGFDPDMPRYQDWELFIRLFKYGSFFFIKEPLILSYITPGSISTNSYAHSVALQMIYDKNRAEIESNRKLNTIWLANLGDAQLRWGAVDKGVNNLIKLWRLNPFSIGIFSRAIAAFFGGKLLYENWIRIINEAKRITTKFF